MDVSRDSAVGVLCGANGNKFILAFGIRLHPAAQMSVSAGCAGLIRSRRIITVRVGMIDIEDYSRCWRLAVGFVNYAGNLHRFTAFFRCGDASFPTYLLRHPIVNRFTAITSAANLLRGSKIEW